MLVDQRDDISTDMWNAGPGQESHVFVLKHKIKVLDVVFHYNFRLNGYL